MTKEELDEKWEKVAIIQAADMLNRQENPFKYRFLKRVLEKYGITEEP